MVGTLLTLWEWSWSRNLTSCVAKDAPNSEVRARAILQMFFFCSFSKFNFHLKTLRLNSSSLRVCPISYACMHPQAGRRYLNLVLLYHLSYHPVPLLCSPEVIVWDMQHQERIIPGGKHYSPGLSPSHSFTISPFFRLHLFIYLCQFVFSVYFFTAIVCLISPLIFGILPRPRVFGAPRD